MKRVALIAALVGMVAASPGWAAGRGNCYSPSAMEAHHAIRFLTDLMVVSSACQDTAYGEFRQRNQNAIIGYQKALIAHFRGNAAFDKWNTALANQAAQKQASVPPAQFCQQAETLRKQASTLDAKAYHTYAAAQAAADTENVKCRK